MTKRMLIDATHAEETRVVVLDGDRLEDFDVETSTKRQIKGNIYLARVVRVEPSLQAAFVEYGGNRHGFLAFSEIHPDYYQIPVADRERLLALQAEEAKAEALAEEATADAEASAGGFAEESEGQTAGVSAAFPASEPSSSAAAVSDSGATDSPPPPAQPAEDQPKDQPAAALNMPYPARVSGAQSEFPVTAVEPEQTLREPFSLAPSEMLTEGWERPEAAEAAAEEEATKAATSEKRLEASEAMPAGHSIEQVSAETPPPETMGGEGDAADEVSERRIPPRFLRQYKIQEVIRRRQIMLVQVIKEERGNKGAALTTYISLAGRFCVLMPNSPRGGGISRKITSPADRRRLKEIISELNVPQGMGLIIRTAGANRPKAEIKRDYDYLLRLWDDIRETTLRSVAPALIYEEASLIKRAIRDVYSRDIDEVIVDGEEGYRVAREFMRMLMPAHAKKVVLWQSTNGGGRQPLFAHFRVESQLDAMHLPTVDLPSGGSLVINQTEALVAIDVNSGRSTRERNVEDTALRTNLEAADEIARQLRLRDLAGLIVIDFIDMESKKHNAMVERRLKEALKNDRARIQLGRISHFGLLEMSRQRLRPSLAETSFVVCPTCGGTGHLRSTESAAVHALRRIEEEAARKGAVAHARSERGLHVTEFLVHLSGAVALYILNHKRERLSEIETRYGLRVTFAADESLPTGQMRIEHIRAHPQGPAEPAQAVTLERVAALARTEAEKAEVAGAEAEEAEALRAEAAEEELVPSATPEPVEPAAEEADRRRKRRRRRRKRREEIATAVPSGGLPAPADTALDLVEEPYPLAAQQPEVIEAAPAEFGIPEHPPIAARAPEQLFGLEEQISVSESEAVAVVGAVAPQEPKEGRRRPRQSGARARVSRRAKGKEGTLKTEPSLPLHEEMAIASAAELAPAVEQPPETKPALPPEPATPEPAAAPEPRHAAEEPEKPPSEAPAPEPAAEPLIKPIIVGPGLVVAEKKRGWWRH